MQFRDHQSYVLCWVDPAQASGTHAEQPFFSQESTVQCYLKDAQWPHSRTSVRAH